MVKIAPAGIGNLANMMAVPQNSEDNEESFESFTSQELRHDLLFGEKLATSERQLDQLNSMNKSKELGKKFAIPSLPYSLRDMIVGKGSNIDTQPKLRSFGGPRYHIRRGAN